MQNILAHQNETNMRVNQNKLPAHSDQQRKLSDSDTICILDY